MSNKFRTFKIILVTLWLFICFVLLILINTLGYSILLDRIVKIYVFSSPVVGGISIYLKRKENELNKLSKSYSYVKENPLKLLLGII